jgi:hypothetical protein
MVNGGVRTRAIGGNDAHFPRLLDLIAGAPVTDVKNRG